MGYKIEYSDDKVYAWGGFSVMKNFNDKIGLRTILRDLPIPESNSNNRYEKEDLIESFLLSNFSVKLYALSVSVVNLNLVD